MRLMYPTRIVSQWGARRSVGEVVAELNPSASKYALVTGRSERYDAIRDEIAQNLGPAAIHFREVSPEPKLPELDDLLDVLRADPPDFVIAIGGGSVIDVAKAGAALAPFDGSAADYFYGKREIAGKGLTFVALPTTAGTGAEITKNSVLIDPETKIKQSIRHPFMVPDAAICDAELTVSMPAALTAHSGLDALTQAIEAYLTRGGNHATRALAAKAIELIFKNLIAAYVDGTDRSARSAVCDGSLLTAMSFSQSGLGAVHGLAHPLGSLLDIPHGKCCAVLLPYVLNYNSAACERRLEELAAAVGLYSAEAFTQGVVALCARLGIPDNFRADGLREHHFPFIVENCRSNSMKGNPVHMPDEDVVALLQELS